ncbi:MAG: helix-turn-helix domain-containing protein [Alistipes shahii]
MLGINPAGISHILKDRNKPSFDLLQKILRRFPQINPDWLLLDSTQMYRDEHTGIPQASAPTSAMQPPIDSDLFGSAGTDEHRGPRCENQPPGARGFRSSRSIGHRSVSGQPNRSQRSACRTVLRRPDLRKFHVDKALKFFVEKIPRNIPRTKSQNPDTKIRTPIIKSTPFFRCAFFMSRNWHATCCPPPHKNELILPLLENRKSYKQNVNIRHTSHSEIRGVCRESESYRQRPA